MKIAVLGAGMVGRAIAIDLSKKYFVTSFDISEHSLQLLKEKGIHTNQTDLCNYAHYPQLLNEFDMVVTAVPGFMGFDCLKAVIEAKKNVVDISFFPEDALQLDKLAKANKVTAIVDCGVAPGISNLVLGYYNEQMEVKAFDCMVGGLPQKRVKPFEYKAPFSPIDVIEEYIRPARLMENGTIVTKPALTEAELIDFDEIGTLEAFNTDGLRSLLFTMGHIPNMKEKTLRYPGHIDLIKTLKLGGFFNHEPINFKGTEISPLEFASAILITQWKLGLTEEEFTIMRVIVKGELDGKEKTVQYDLLDRYDHFSQTSSMARTTGYTCTAAVNMLIEKLFTEKGVFPPELVGRHPECFEYILKYLAERKIYWQKTEC
ncbi:MAG: saccharopine dehydrogenase NADP-binding domain-containing protein [Sphingobacteriales bacterium]|nr:saccharopine dehydrogenase NADP-binding domain-containing protein [Sphingobacteriales bacterium]MBI3719248.1 saccharopine dehydrogenase NADP-binding domain-containing protein [Sphingobacteriales bacterium]